MAIKSDSPGDDVKDIAADKMENAGVLMRKGGKRGGKRRRGRKGGKRGA
jgi:hypothetical protein